MKKEVGVAVVRVQALVAVVQALVVQALAAAAHHSRVQALVAIHSQVAVLVVRRMYI